jgi:hypothetical protein
MTREELERSMGRIADQLSSSEGRRTNGVLKGQILRIYIELRNRGALKQSLFRRLSYRRAMKRHFENCGLIEHAKATADHQQETGRINGERERLTREYHEKHAEWTRQVKKLPLFKRWFAAPSRPAWPLLPSPPAPPPLPTVFSRESAKRAEMSEFLIASVAEFELAALPADLGHVTPETVHLLAS